MRLYFKNRRSPKAYKVVITSLDNSRIGFIGEITNPTMKIGNGVVQFYLAPLASKGTWTISNDYHYGDGNLTVMAYKNLTYTSYNSHANYSSFVPNIQAALEYIEFHEFETITDAVKDITALNGVEWTYDQENKRFIYYTDNKSGDISLKDLATQINSFLISEDSVLKSNAELFIKDVIADFFLPSPKGFIPQGTFNTQFINNAVITKLSLETYKDTSLSNKSTASLNFNQDLKDRIPSCSWYTEGNGQIVVGGEAFSNKVYYSSKEVGNSLQSPSKLLSGGRTPFTISFDILIKEDQKSLENIPLLSKNLNKSNGDQILYISTNNRLVFERRSGVGGNTIAPVIGTRKIEYNTKYNVKIVYDGNMFKIFVNDILDLQFGSIVGIHIEGDQPYRFLDSFVPSYNLHRQITNGYIDNIEIKDGIAEDPSKEIDAYTDSAVSKLFFQGQVGKTSFVDEVNDTINWTGFGDAKLVQSTELGLYSHLSLDGMGSYLKTTDSDYFKFNNKFTIHIKFKTSTTSKLQILFDRYATQVPGSFQIGINPTGSLVFTKGAIPSYIDLVSSTTNLNNGSINTIDIIKDGSSLAMYINGFLDTMFDVTGDVFNADVPITAIGAQVNIRNESYDFKGSIYEFEVYRGVAVYPNVVAKELNKVEIDFNKAAPLDLYNNSTWTVHSGVTFDKSYSNFGHGAYYNGTGQGIVSGLNNVFNYESDDFKISLDINPEEPGRQYGSTILCSDQVTNYVPVTFGISPNTNTFYANFRSDVSGITYGVASQIGLNTYNHIEVIKIDTYLLLFVNNVLKSFSTNIPKTETFNLNGGSKTILGTNRNDLDGTRFKGYLDNFKSQKGSVDVVKIDKPLINIPLTSNYNNIGLLGLSVLSVNDPTLTIKDGVKCVKFENNKYLTLNSNSVFNLGTEYDFYIEVDVYLENYHTAGYGHAILANGTDNQSQGGLWLQVYPDYSVYGELSKKLALTINEGSPIYIDQDFPLNQWNKVKFYRKGTTLSLELNNIKKTLLDTNLNINLSINKTTLGMIDSANSAATLDGYLSSFKLFRGISELPFTYDSRKVLDLDFKPTYESFLFKDNFNNCVISPHNIYYRNYEDGQYCLKFKNNIEHLLLGKNSLLNFGTDDFIINFKFRNVEDGNWNILLASNISGENDFNYRYISIGSKSRAVPSRVHIHIGTEHLISDNEVSYDEINNLTIVRENTTLKIILNDVETVFENRSDVFNFNNANDTKIGSSFASNSSSHGFKGTLYSVKMFRGTSDLSLLDQTVLEPESPADVILDGIPPLEPGVLQFWQPREDVDPQNVVLEFKQLRLN